MSALHKAMVYLGFSADQHDEYDGYEDEPLAPVTQLHDMSDARGAAPRQSIGDADLRRIQTIKPRSYNDARMIGEAFRAGVPVIMNLTEMDEGDAKRLVDFSAGLSFGLHGSIERVTTAVFLLSPAHVEIAMEAEPQVAEAGFFNQS